jgi:hypothetical protein
MQDLDGQKRTLTLNSGFFVFLLCPRLFCVRQGEEEREASSLAMDFVVPRFVARIQIQAVNSCSNSAKSAHVQSFCTFSFVLVVLVL